jgi:hypothetical protein
VSGSAKRLIFFVFFFLILAVGTATGPVSAAGQVVSFEEFVRQVAAATSGQYVSRAGMRVVGDAEFSAMRAHLLKLYRGVHVTHSYAIELDVFDCIPVAEQPAIRLNAAKSVAAPPPLSAPGSGARSRGSAAGQLQTPPGEEQDAFGNSVQCEGGTIPMRRVTLEEMSRFRTLREFFGKGPDGAGKAPTNGDVAPRATVSHKYAHAFQNVNNHGGNSALNLWKPPINTALNEIFSLSQHWYTAYTGGGKVQTVEGGWQTYPQKYKTTKSVLFIYWTADAYGVTGCYNLDCAAFVQTNSTIRLGGPFANYSVRGGTQYDFMLQWQLFGGNWWLYVDGTAVGYYPGSLYGGGPLATTATGIDYGGETVGSTIWPPMGGGRFPAKGFGYAAYQREIFLITTAGASQWSALTVSQPSPLCYKIKLLKNADPDWSRYFYYGGPGGTGC